jgi:hypothetical protein
MNRTLRRPMFRIGGSAEGITSGLDMPKINASRQGYSLGGKTLQQLGVPQEFINANSHLDEKGIFTKFRMDNREMLPTNVANQNVNVANQNVNNNDMESRYNRAMKFIESKRAPRRDNINDFLISMGLDLVSRPTSGNIFADLGASAKGPFAEYRAAKSQTAGDQDKLSQALIGDIMEQMSDEEIARIKAKAEQGKGGKEFEYKGKYEDYKKLLDTQRNLEAQKRQLEEQNKTVKNPETDEVISGGQFDEQIRIIDQQIEDNAKLQNLFQEKEEDAVRAAILKGISNGIFTFEDLIVYDETGVPPREDAADGGRIGYQQGNMVQPNAMPAAMPMDQGPTQDSTVQDLSFEELRSRLPESITNDVVTLIANSQQALVEFANIQTQQDVKEFNRKYEVNLVLPQEA